ncbi:protein-glutamate methylesterase/protein-glutamine glutaminase [Caldisalinibacter kiritimatiensis]|uniref:Protein-glutamate methylesterase/protein-glutamine glutaminase n=1 Tax=Caldisalinibacter kiritimatiensis TaxID=1304284 RepID=R1CA99_9FIRM|nr:chemotaxis response regulator protein-glutamate methylesterase [Caldisalinibacter kiritimatiensis]EOC99259.1 Chemotaxis response regulator protein-glutamate methylesterase CheB [Caldisalinibacter kiritimatiensis]
MKRKIKVLIIDDSALVREVLSKLLQDDEVIDVVATARDPIDSIEKIKKYKPDVLTLDLQMPKMDGLTFLKRVMALHPFPIIVISSLTKKGSIETIKALELGAIDFVAKPTIGINKGLKDLKEEIIRKVKYGASVDTNKLNRLYRQSKVNINTSEIQKNVAKKSTIELIAIGASTGGTNAVRYIVKKFPKNLPPVIVVLHMPPRFTTTYAEDLNKTCVVTVKEAQDGEEILDGTVYIAPGDRHLTIQKGISGYYIKIDQGPKINHVRPSIDKTFFSIADIVSPNCIGVILTGMGNDGAKGLKKMHNRGSLTIAQDEESSIVFGMPKQAIDIGAVDKVYPLDEIAFRILEALNKN